MDEVLAQLTSYLRDIWRRRWIGLGVAWLAALIGAAVVMSIPDRYEASARVFVDTQSLLKPLLSGLAVQPDIDQQLAILSRTLVSRPNVERLIRMTDMDLRLNSTTQKEEMIERLQRTLKISTAVGRDNLYTISYQDPSPDQAKRVVQSLLSIFVESGLGGKRKDADAARRFIEEQIKHYEKRLEDAENRLKEFRLRNMQLLGPDGRGTFDRMSALSESLNAAKLELRAAEESRDTLKRELEGETPIFLPDAGTGSSLVPELDSRIDAQKKNLDELLRRYTDQHPDIIGTRRVIEQLEEERKKEIAARVKPSAPGGTPRTSAMANPVIQQLRFALAEAEANVGSLRARTNELEARYAQLRAAAQMRPELEVELAQLNRDYDVQKRQYESLVARRESAAISGEMDATGSVADFRVIDPPIASQKPVAPNRVLLSLVAFVFALGAGVVASFIVSQIFPTLHDVATLQSVSQRPVLGAVTLLMTDARARTRRRKDLAFAGALGGLFVVYGAAILLLTTASRSI